MLVVSDTSPITSLLSIRREMILLEVFRKVVIPTAVADELRSYHTSIPEFIEIADVKDVEAVQVLSAQLDRGEAESIVLAKKRSLLDSVSETPDSLEKEAGFYLSQEVKALALKEAGEQ